MVNRLQHLVAFSDHPGTPPTILIAITRKPCAVSEHDTPVEVGAIVVATRALDDLQLGVEGPLRCNPADPLSSTCRSPKTQV